MLSEISQRQAILSSAVSTAPSQPRSNKPDDSATDPEMQRPTKAQALELQVKSIVALTQNFEKSSGARELYLKKKLNCLNVKQNGHGFLI